MYEFDINERLAIRDALSEEYIRMSRHVSDTKQSPGSAAYARVELLKQLLDRFKADCR